MVLTKLVLFFMILICPLGALADRNIRVVNYDMEKNIEGEVVYTGDYQDFDLDKLGDNMRIEPADEYQTVDWYGLSLKNRSLSGIELERFWFYDLSLTNVKIKNSRFDMSIKNSKITECEFSNSLFGIFLEDVRITNSKLIDTKFYMLFVRKESWVEDCEISGFEISGSSELEGLSVRNSRLSVVKSETVQVDRSEFIGNEIEDVDIGFLSISKSSLTDNTIQDFEIKNWVVAQSEIQDDLFDEARQAQRENFLLAKLIVWIVILLSYFSLPILFFGIQ